MFKFVKDLTTGIDGKTHDPARVLWIVFSLSFVVFTAWAVFHKPESFDPQNFGLGAGGLLGGGGAGVGFKAKTEPQLGNVGA